MRLTSEERLLERWHALLQAGATDGCWRALYDQDAYLPRRALRWLIDPHAWEPWQDDPGHFQRPRPPAGHRYWFQLFHDATGLGCTALYPTAAAPCAPIKVLLPGAGPGGRQVEEAWVHGRGGLVEERLMPWIERMVVRVEAGG